MKHRFLYIMALLLTLATGAWAQDPDPIDLTPSADGTVWTLSTMPEYDIELEVTYYTDEEIYMEGVELTKVANGLWTLASTPAFNIELEIVYYPAASVTTAPTAVSGLAFTGQDQALVTAGVCEGGEMQYSLDGTAWSTDIPTAINEGNYIVYYKAVGDDTHSDSEPASVEVTIGAALPIDLTSTDGKLWTLAEMPAYDVELQVTYYELPELAWKIGTEDVPSTGVTTCAGFPFTAPTLVNPHQLTPISFASTYQTVATIDETSGAITLVAPGTTTIRAIFAGNETYQEDTASYLLTVLAPAVLTLASNNSDWGSVTLNTGTTLPEGVIAGETEVTFRVLPGTVVTLNAEATAQHHVAGWKDENQNDLATATYSNYAVTTPSNMFPRTSALTFTVTGDTTAMAMFGINSSDITASVANTTDVRGTVKIDYTDVQGQSQSEGPTTASATVTAQGGSTSTLTAAPADGYHFVKWTNANGDSLSNLTTLSITSSVDTALVAVFDTNTYALTVVVANGQSNRGTVAGSNSAAKHFLEYQISATANEGYHFVNWTENNTVVSTSATYGFTVTGARTLVANFAVNVYDVTVNVTKDNQHNNVAMGTVQGPATLEHFATANYTATANYGYHFVNWTNTSNEVLGTESTYNLSGLSDGYTLNANFTYNQYTVTAQSANSTMGTASGTATVNYLSTVTLTATPNYGYHFVNWTNAAGTVLGTETSLTVQALRDSMVYAVFDTNTYVLTVLSDNEVMGSVNGSTTAAKHFKSYQISATANEGYHFVQWNDGNTDNPRTVSLVSDSTFTASFAPDTFTVTYMNGTAQLKVEKVPYRESIPEYTPSKQGRTFDGWTPTLPELMPAENLTTYAQWTCDSVLDIDENKYPAVNIGNKCWMAENLRTRHYADGREIAHIYEYQTVLNPTVPQQYGLLYDWYDALDVNRPATRATGSIYTQGVCPADYHIPTAEEVALLIHFPANALCSTDGWITPNDNSNSANFSAYPAGLYNAAPARYEGLGTQTDWWMVSGTQSPQSMQIQYYCNTPQIVTRNPNDAVSVRCVLND